MIDLQQSPDADTQSIKITLISMMEVKAETLNAGEHLFVTWTPKGLFDRQLEAPASFVEQMAIDVIKFPGDRLVRRDGLQLEDGCVRAVRHIEFCDVGVDAPWRVQILCLVRFAKAFLFESAAPVVWSQWPFVEEQIEVIEELRKSILLKCGGQTLKSGVGVVVNGEQEIELSGRYAPKPDLSSSKTEDSVLIGYVTGQLNDKEAITLMDQNEQRMIVYFGKQKLSAQELGKLIDDRTLISVEVKTGRDKFGKPEHTYVEHAATVRSLQ
ncbi:MAG: hypothetical protein V4739_03285 [Pseudomonadota bacterium]